MGVMVGRGVGWPFTTPWLAREKTRPLCRSSVSAFRQATPDQFAQRNPERLGLTIRTLTQFVRKQDGGAMHMALNA